MVFVFFKQKTAYEMRISDWSADVCSSDLFNPARLHGLSERLITSHHENNYAGSVKALNMIETRLDAALADTDLPPVVYGGLKREELHRTGSVVLHGVYFDGVGGNGTAAGSIRGATAAGSCTFDRGADDFR